MRKPTILAVAWLAALPMVPANAADLAVLVTGDAGPGGEVGCTLYRGPQGFPMELAAARRIWVAAAAGQVVCRFADVPAGEYAVAVSRDLNGNRQVDTNFVGIPSEPWGVSNNIRPSLRAPRFEEAKFRVGDGPTTVTVSIAR